MRRFVSINNEALVRPVFYHYKLHIKMDLKRFLYGISSLFGVKRLQKQK